MIRRMLLICGVMLMAFASHSQQNKLKESAYVEGDIIIQTVAGVSLRDILNRAPESYKLGFEQTLSAPMRLSLVHFDHTVLSHEQMLHWLYSQPEISIAQNNHYVKLRATVPNDTDFGEQWHHVNNGTAQQGNGTVDADIDSDLAWDITTGGTTATGEDIVVCLIESGNLDHNDIDANRWFNAAEIPNNNIDDDGNGYIDDYNGWNPVQGNDNYGNGGHGTNCLGMIGAVGNNNYLVTGANWDVKLMVVGDYNISTEANAIQAYTYPLVMRQIWNNTSGASGAFVVATSSSWGIDGGDPATVPAWCAFYDTLGYYGILNVGATTNQNLDVDVAGDIPTACASDYMIGVGRTDNDDNTAGGYGDQTIELGAPGINVVTTANTNTTTTTTGTSFSCPLTAGVIGLAYSIPCTDFMNAVKANPQAGADMVLAALLAGVDPKPQLATRFVTGGRLNSRGTLDELMLVACNGSICFPPSGISTSNITSSSAQATFTSDPVASSSILYWREVGVPVWTEVPGVTSPYNFSNLNGCADYEYYMVSVCSPDTSSVTSTYTFSTLGCGNCIDLNYCTSGATDGIDEWIETLTIDTYTNNSGNDGGFGDFTNTGSISLVRDATYPIQMVPGWSGTLYDEYTRIWIDVDQSGTFDAGELLFDQGSANQATVNGNVTIPANAVLGSTRMRVQMAYLGSGQNTLPPECGSFTWGEVEDYCLDIQNNVVCGMTVTSTPTNPDCFGASTGSISIDNVSGGTPSYTYDWGPNGGNVPSISNLDAGTYTVTITDGALCDTSITFTLNDPAAMTANTSTVNPDCNGAATGSITVNSITNGTPNYTYDWGAAGGNVTSISNLTAGNYNLTVTDDNNCQIQFNYTLTDPAAHSASFTSNVTGMSVAFTNTSVGTGTDSWDFGDANSSTQTSPTHTYAASGTFTVCLTHTTSCVTDQTCSDLTVTDLGVDGYGAYLVSVFPNPSKGAVNFEITDPSVSLIEIVDVSGRVIRKVERKEELTQINLGGEAHGTYIYRLRNHVEEIVYTDKLIIVE